MTARQSAVRGITRALMSKPAKQRVRPPSIRFLRFETTVRDGRVYITGPIEAAPLAPPQISRPGSILIIGGGAAGFSAADTLLRHGYTGDITLVSSDADVAYDRPALSKEYLAGEEDADTVEIRSVEYLRERGIRVLTGATVSALDPKARTATLSNGDSLSWDALILAPGSEPVRLDVPGAETGEVLYLRTFADSQRIVEAAKKAKTAVVVGASFIGMEVAASLRKRNIDVTVVAPEEVPFVPIVGEDIGRIFQEEHERQGVQFKLGRTVSRVNGARVELDDGSKLQADLIVVGVGVKPRLELAKLAGLTCVDDGVTVDGHMATSIEGIWAAGDIAHWPDRYLGRSIKAEHWIVAERHGRVAAENAIGIAEPLMSPPVFWTRQFDLSLGYVGHAEEWDELSSMAAWTDREFIAGFMKDGRIEAVAAMNRDQDWLASRTGHGERRPESVGRLFDARRRRVIRRHVVTPPLTRT